METKFRQMALRLIKENFSPFEFAELFQIDKSNACAYLRGSKLLPLSLAFKVLDYLGARCVIFRPQ